MPSTKFSFIRYKILDKCFRSPKNYQIQDLIDACVKELNVENISRRTIYYDIEFMKSSDGWDAPIEINIRNTDHPDDAGTTIVRRLPHGETKYPIVGVAGRKGMSVIQVEKVMVSDESGFTAILLDMLKNRLLQGIKFFV